MALPRDEAEHVRSGYGPQQPDRTPPQNIELEMSVLGGIMLEPKDAFPLVADFLSRDSFYWEGHAVIFDVMADLHRSGIPPDSVAVLDALRGRELLVKAGGSGVVLGMLNSVPTAANVEHHARRVAEKAYLRQLIRACTRVIEDCYRQELPLPDIIDRAESSILQLSAHSAGSGSGADYQPIAHFLGQYMDELSERVDEIERREAAGEKNVQLTPGLATGFKDFDKLTGGLKKQVLTIIAARPGLGKSAMIGNMIHDISVKRGLPVLLFSLEMGGRQIAERLLCSDTVHTVSTQQGQVARNVSTMRLNNPRLDDQEWGLLQGSYERLHGSPVLINDRGYIRPGDLRSMARRAYSEHGIEAVFVDYLQLMTATRETDNRVQDITEISRSLKLLAQELRIPVVALSQLSRECERGNREPKLSDLRDSGAIEQDADTVLFIHNPHPTDNAAFQKRKIIVAKNRGGPTENFTMLWHGESTRFFDMAQERQDEPRSLSSGRQAGQQPQLVRAPRGTNPNEF